MRALMFAFTFLVGVGSACGGEEDGTGGGMDPSTIACTDYCVSSIDCAIDAGDLPPEDRDFELEHCQRDCTAHLENATQTCRDAERTMRGCLAAASCDTLLGAGAECDAEIEARNTAC